MTQPSPPMPVTRRTSLKPLRWWWILAGVVIVAVAGAGTSWLVWRQSIALPPLQLAQARIEAIRIGLTAAGGTGAALALILAFRRQRATEIGLELQNLDITQKERASVSVEFDANERRVTELFARAIEHLGDDNPVVKLGGVFALERLGQATSELRQTVVDIYCTYLRMPFDYSRLGPPRLESGGLRDGAPAVDQITSELARQERQVRETIQRVLQSHLQPGPPSFDRVRVESDEKATNPRYWSDIALDLSGAFLTDFRLASCAVRSIDLRWSTLAGETLFRDCLFDMFFIQASNFTHGLDANSFIADFRGSIFQGPALFHGATFNGRPMFNADTFFSGPKFEWAADFVNVNFKKGANFAGADFAEPPDFSGVETGDNWVIDGLPDC